jgi:hypothetical protein
LAFAAYQEPGDDIVSRVRHPYIGFIGTNRSASGIAPTTMSQPIARSVIIPGGEKSWALNNL